MTNVNMILGKINKYSNVMVINSNKIHVIECNPGHRLQIQKFA